MSAQPLPSTQPEPPRDSQARPESDPRADTFPDTVPDDLQPEGVASPDAYPSGTRPVSENVLSADWKRACRVSEVHISSKRSKRLGAEPASPLGVASSPSPGWAESAPTLEFMWHAPDEGPTLGSEWRTEILPNSQAATAAAEVAPAAPSNSQEAPAAAEAAPQGPFAPVASPDRPLPARLQRSPGPSAASPASGGAHEEPPPPPPRSPPRQGLELQQLWSLDSNWTTV